MIKNSIEEWIMDIVVIGLNMVDLIIYIDDML